MSSSYHRYHVTSRILVSCIDCGTEWLKSKYTLKEWLGRCRSCASKFIAAKPEIALEKSLRAREQVLRQGGIPNAKHFTSESVSGEKNINWTGGVKRILVQCSECGRRWKMDKSNFRRWKGKCLVCFCKTREFTPERLKAMSEQARARVLQQGGIPNARKFDGSNNAKENHPNWKGGITPLTKAIRQSVKYKEWRTAIFTRDDYTCQICDIRGVELHADHYPSPFSNLFADFQKLNIGADDYAPFWDVSNGRTLCKDCHRVYGWNFFKVSNPRIKRSTN